MDQYPGNPEVLAQGCLRSPTLSADRRLVADHPNKKLSKKQSNKLGSHVHQFLDSYAKHLGMGAAYLTIGCAAALLNSLGIGPDVTTLIKRR